MYFRHILSATAALLASLTAFNANADEIYSKSFNSSSALSGCTVIDANKDGSTFKMVNSGTLGYTLRNDGQAGGTNDWVITPAITLKKGFLYEFTVNCASWSDKWTEYFEAYCGTAATAEGMTIEIIPKTSDNSLHVFKDYNGTFTCPADGVYYFGLHSCNPGDSFYLYVTKFTITEKAVGTAPSACTGVSVTPDWDGGLKAEITATAPTSLINGDMATSLSALTITRNGEAIYTVNNPSPGQTYKYTDNVDAADYYTYVITASNDMGDGTPTEFRKFVGVNTPYHVSDITITELSTPGMVTVSWTPANADKDGVAMNPDLISYDLIRAVNGEAIYVARGLKECSYTFNALLDDGSQQCIVYCGVSAVTAAGASARTPASAVVAVGYPYDTPYIESFANCAPTHLFASNRTNGNTAAWSLADNSKFGDSDPQDEDNGYAFMYSNTKYDSAEMILGKINLPTTNPVLSFWYLFQKANDQNNLKVVVYEGSERHIVATITKDNDDVNTWHKAEVSLADYAGKMVSLCLEGEIVSSVYMFVDNITLLSKLENNLKALELSAPSLVNPGEEFTVEAKIENIGSKSASGWSAELYCNNQIVKSEEGATLAAGETATFSFPITLSLLDNDVNVYRLSVNYEADNDLSDNTSANKMVALNYPDYPFPDNLTASKADGSVILNWEAPESRDGFTLEGYNIFCNKQKIASTDAATTTYTHVTDYAGDKDYQVTALFSQGESAPTNTATVKADASVDGINADALDIKTAKGQIIIGGAQGQPISVITIDGMTVEATVGAEGDTIINVATGVYAVKVADKVAKVVVK